MLGTTLRFGQQLEYERRCCRCLFVSEPAATETGETIYGGNVVKMGTRCVCVAVTGNTILNYHQWSDCRRHWSERNDSVCKKD
uniref:Uncharacterized protein n=1 Tax=Hyaloperonospora arabidopsidis (strain Emoy2) TaxID=559515 RepID=M4BW36_HYAAE